MPKPVKPRRDFPLTAHRNGQWCKKIRGKIHYFGTDPNAALQKYLDERDDLQAGRQPKRQPGSVTTEYLIRAFLDRQQSRVAAGDISPITLNDHHEIGRLVAQHLGKTTDAEQLSQSDFQRFRLALRFSPARVSKIVTATRGMFKWAAEAGVIAHPPKFGPDFKVANRKALRLHKAQQGKKLLTAAEIRALIKAADPQLKAILYLCINGGLGNSDIARLKVSDVNGDWLNFPRGKTGIDRRIPLWKETVNAVAEIATGRNPEELLFRTKTGRALIKVQAGGTRSDRTGQMFRDCAKAAGVNHPRLGLYWLRHTFQTIGDGARDAVATSSIMGHVDATMAGNYRQTIEDERLVAVVDHVRNWLLSENIESKAVRMVRLMADAGEAPGSRRTP
jgi:integrase